MTTPFLMGEGQHIDHFGNLITLTFVDFRGAAQRLPINTLVKGSRTEYAIQTCRKVLISKPSRFRNLGENLIRDLGEAFASHEQVTYEAVDDAGQLAEAHRRNLAMNRVYELVGANVRTTTTSVRRTRSNGQSLTWGKNGWIFCASIEPTTTQEWALWRATLEDDYDHVSYIERPREFARALATAVAEQLGPQGRTSELTHSFRGEPKLRTDHPVQMIYHGPVVYVDDVYALINEATSEHERALLPMFAKANEYRDQREYRFFIWAEAEPTQETELLTAFPALLGAMRHEGSSAEPQIMPPAEYIDDEDEAETEDFDDDPDEEAPRERLFWGDEIGEDSNNTQDFARSLMELADDPATNLRPNKINPIKPLPDDFSTLTAIYSGVVALRNKVKSISDADGRTVQQKLETASAAFYAEQHIRSLCESFDDPISGISVTPDNYVVIKVSLHERSDVTCRMAVAPTGQCAIQLVVQRRPITVNVESPWPRSTIGQMMREFLEDPTGPRQLNGETEARQQLPCQPA